MKRFTSLIILILFSIQPSFSARKRVLNLFGQEITDVSNIKIPNRIRRVNLDSNLIISLEGLNLPPKLKVLDLDLNLLTSLNGLEINEALEVLEISGNPTIEDYSKLNEFNNIKILTLSFNSLSNKNFDFDFVTSGIEELVIAGNVFKELDLSQFVNLKKLNMKAMFPFSRGLTEFLLDYSKVVLPDNLSVLLMGGNDFGDQDFSQLVLPKSIEELDMATASLDQEELKTLKLPPNLKRLRLKRNQISSLDDIELPESLEVLNLQLNPLTKEEKQKIKARLGKKVKVIFKCGRKCANSA